MGKQIVRLSSGRVRVTITAIGFCFLFFFIVRPPRDPIWRFAGFGRVLLGFTELLLGLVLRSTGFYRVFLGFTGSCIEINWAIPSVTGFYRVLQGFTEFYWVLPSFYLVLPSFTWFYRVLLGFVLRLSGFYRVLLGFTEFYWVLPSFTEFYRVQLGFEL